MNATTRRATMPIAEDYDIDEPNVKLSKAFFVVMLLHVVAVGGIFAFSSLKKNTPAPMDTPLVESPAKGSDLPADSRIYTIKANDNLGSIASTFGLTRNDLETANHLTESSSIKMGDKLIIPTKSTAQPVPLNVQKLLQLSQNTKTEPLPVKVSNTTPAAPKTAPAVDTVAPAGGKIYVVQKGDNPVLIAKRQGVKYADLLTANKITDPKKLQIGQKLIIPSK
ncbi:MAG: LysM peptidoglycan-binding domain-containing protein [Chthoniobacterales bacterium]